MAYAYSGASALDYYPCRYGKSRLLFRGPRRDLKGDYVAMFGGSETYGRFVPEPFSVRVEAESDIKMVNLGCVNAGLDAYIGDPTLLEIASGARVTVVQVMGACNMSNRFYSVHPRRNDRFLKASPLLQKIFREVDFADFNFTRHMLSTLREISEDKFEVVTEELRLAWVARMKQLLARIDGKTLVLWMADTPPAPAGEKPDLDRDPMLIDIEMLQEVIPHATEYLEVVVPKTSQADVEGMVFAPLEQAVAEQMPGPMFHQAVADALGPVLRRMV